MPRQTRKKKGGKQLELSDMDSSKVKKTENENKSFEGGMDNASSNKSFEGGMDKALENEFSTNNNNKNLEGGNDNNIQMQVNDIVTTSSNNNNASSMLGSMGNMIKNAVNGLTGSSNAVKVGGAGASNLQNKLFTSLKARSNKLSENLLELDSLQKNLNAKTNSVKSEVQGLQEQFKLYNKMGGGRKSRKKHKKHHKSKRRSHHRRKTKRRRQRRKH